MKDVRVISKTEDIKIFADINRFAILDCLATYKLLSTNEISDKTGLSYYKVSYGLKKLEEANMVKVAETRVKFGINEKYYSLAAKEFQILPRDEEEEKGKEYTNNFKLLDEIILKSLIKEYLSNSYKDDPDKEDNNILNEITIDNIYLNNEEFQELNEKMKLLIREAVEPHMEKKREDQKPFTLAKIFFSRS